MNFDDLLNFPPLNIGSLNCNSLNLSTVTSRHQRLKVYTITKLKKDFIFLSDIRLKPNDPATKEIEKQFLVNPFCSYNFNWHCLEGKRGVGILSKQSLNVVLQVIAADLDSNWMAAKTTVNGKELILISVYGPNETDAGFFDSLSKFLSDYRNKRIIIAGDWNTTVSCNSLATNIDVLNMATLPNPKNSKMLESIRLKYDLIDPYRIFFPNKRDFTYQPRVAQRTNRSRLDFFLISKNLGVHVQSCDISPTVENSLFDHKSISLSFEKKKCRPGRQIITDTILNHDLLEVLATISAAECYLHHAETVGKEEYIAFKLTQIGEVRSIIRTLCDQENQADTGLNVERIRNRADLLIADINLPAIQEMSLVIDCDLFLEVLVNNIRNDLVSFQSYLCKKQKKVILDLLTELNLRKEEGNFNEVFRVEKSLTDIVDKKAKIEFEKLKNFEVLHMEKITPYFLKLAKSSKPEGQLWDIRDLTKTPFASKSDQENFIVNYYADVFKIPENRVKVRSGDIEKFLGDD